MLWGYYKEVSFTFNWKRLGGPARGDFREVPEGRDGASLGFTRCASLGQNHGKWKGDNNGQRHRDQRMKIRSGDKTVWCGALE